MITASVPQTRHTLDGIQMLRALAAIAVVVHHTLINLAQIAGAQSPLNGWGHFDELGAAGVDLFFVISGFIMLYVSQGEFGREGAVGRFLWRRAIRIYPLYWFYTLLIIALSTTPWMFRNLQLDFPYVAGSLLLIPVTRPDPASSIHPILDQGWTLSYELGFYLLFALGLRFGSARRFLMFLPLAFGLLVMLGQALDPASAAAQFLRLPLTFEFYFGLLIAWLLSRGHLPERGHLVLALLGLAFFALSAAFRIDASLRPLVWGMPSALLVIAALGISPVRGIAGQVGIALGNASYSIYLTHAFGIFVMARIAVGYVNTPLAALAWQCATVLVCIAGGYVAYMLIERPLLARLISLQPPPHLSTAA